MFACFYFGGYTPALTAFAYGLGSHCFGGAHCLDGSHTATGVPMLEIPGHSYRACDCTFVRRQCAGRRQVHCWAAYAILPAAGRDGGTLLAAVISLLVALYVIDKIKRQPGLFEAGSDRAVTALTAMPVPPPTRQAWAP